MFWKTFTDIPLNTQLWSHSDIPHHWSLYRTLTLAARQMLLPITPSDHVIKYDTVIADGKSAANGRSWQAKGGWRKITRGWRKHRNFPSVNATIIS